MSDRVMFEHVEQIELFAETFFDDGAIVGTAVLAG
jgi:hypothetical protein